MKNRNTVWLVVIILLAALTIYVDLPTDHPDWFVNLAFWQPEGQRSIEIHRGLDLAGGLQVLLRADTSGLESRYENADELSNATAAAIDGARQIVESRVNALGLTEPVVQAQGEQRIIVELPGVDDPDEAIATIRSTALLEFVDTGATYLPPGTQVHTTLGGPSTTPDVQAPTVELNATEDLAPAQTDPRIFETVLTGADLKEVGLNVDQQTNEYLVQFELQPDKAQVFADFTGSHVGQYLCIAMDKVIISCPTINSQIPSGSGSIQGQFSYEEARNLTIQLRYGALPVPLVIESSERISPTLGSISVERSVQAGIVGLSVVLIFMLVYYRLPGLLADLALVLYVLLNLALFKLLPVTLTLPGIAGFLLSAGMAVDANILIFERMKEELRRGRSLSLAIEIGFSRAWTSIRDSQLSTLIICAILFFFGRTFGASIVKGFAITLALGTVINLFTAITVTRTFVGVAFERLGDWLRSRKWALGI